LPAKFPATGPSDSSKAGPEQAIAATREQRHEHRRQPADANDSHTPLSCCFGSTDRQTHEDAGSAPGLTAKIAAVDTGRKEYVLRIMGKIDSSSTPIGR